METVWELRTDRTFRGWGIPTMDEVPTLFHHSSSKSKREWLRDQCLWTKVHVDADGSVFMGFLSPEEQDVNYLATRILVDQNQLNIIAEFRNTDNQIAHCVRGPALFYRLPHKTNADIATNGNSPSVHRSIGLYRYSWEMFRMDWPKFFRVADARMPYIRIERSISVDFDPISEWLSVAIRENSTKIDEYARLLDLQTTAGTKRIINAALLAVTLRRVNRHAWETIDMRVLLRDQQKRHESTQ